ncbi:MAG: hypothetical protein AB8B86_04510 [Pseudomonadales bacterium]
MTTAPTPEQARSNKIKLLILIFVPFTLMLMAWVMFYSGIGMPKGTGNKGVLINPPLQLNEVSVDAATKIVETSNFKWFFLLPGTASCDKACEERLYLTRQIRTALGKYTHKIQRLYLVDSSLVLSNELQTLLKEEHEDLIVQRVSAEKLKQMLASQEQSSKSQASKDIYLADFRGFIMMYYNESHTYKDIMKDIKFLLKYAP